MTALVKAKIKTKSAILVYFVQHLGVIYRYLFNHYLTAAYHLCLSAKREYADNEWGRPDFPEKKRKTRENERQRETCNTAEIVIRLSDAYSSTWNCPGYRQFNPYLLRSQRAEWTIQEVGGSKSSGQVETDRHVISSTTTEQKDYDRRRRIVSINPYPAVNIFSVPQCCRFTSAMSPESATGKGWYCDAPVVLSRRVLNHK